MPRTPSNRTSRATQRTTRQTRISNRNTRGNTPSEETSISVEPIRNLFSLISEWAVGGQNAHGASQNVFDIINSIGMTEQERNLSASRFMFERNRTRSENQRIVRNIYRRVITQNPTRIKERMRATNPNALTLSGLDNALIGMTHDGLGVYEKNLIISTIMEKDNRAYDEAEREYNSLIQLNNLYGGAVFVDLGYEEEAQQLPEKQPKKRKTRSTKKNVSELSSPKSLDPIQGLEI